MESPDALLREWFDWWEQSDDAPAKMPKALHVRTVTYLTIQDFGHWKAHFDRTGCARCARFDDLQARTG